MLFFTFLSIIFSDIALKLIYQIEFPYNKVIFEIKFKI